LWNNRENAARDFILALIPGRPDHSNEQLN
jgi:hypothetical protein